MAVPAARLLSRRAHRVPGQLHVTELFFEVPRNYRDPAAGNLNLFGRVVNKYERSIVTGSDDVDLGKPYLAYLEGGPGIGNREPQDIPLTRYLLDRGYQVLYLDYRGTGLSTPINAEHLATLGPAQAQADYLKLFRADNIVRDCEAVRQCLATELSERERSKPGRALWSLFGQSFGGFVALTYLSKHPQGLREVFLTGGLAPLRSTAEDVYRRTFAHVAARNQAYYRKFPEDVAAVRRIAAHLQQRRGVPLPDGGTLTAGRLLSAGLGFGSHGGIDGVHAMVLKLDADLDQFGFITRAGLALAAAQIPFDANPIYAILHEPIYCYEPGVASNWAAWRVGQEVGGNFAWLATEAQDHNVPTSSSNGTGSSTATSDATSLPLRPATTTVPSGNNFEAEAAKQEGHNDAKGPLFFSGEMVYPFHFDTYAELAPLKETADLLARFDGWDEPLYDLAQLARNEVPVYAAGFADDMYVDVELARQTAAALRNCHVFETNQLYHNAVRFRPDEVLGQLFRMRDDSLD